MKLSVVIPVYNEMENLRTLHEEIVSELEALGTECEIIFVDDGSRDSSFQVLSGFADGDPRVKVLRLRRNFGQTAALTAGFSMASGECIISMDGDLQNDPADIPRLLRKIDEGYDIVSGWRKDRKDHFFSRRLPSFLANRLISLLTGVWLHDYGCTLKAYRRETLQEINLYGELHRFVPALASQVGAQVAEIPVNHRPRLAGKSNYGIDRTMRVILDLLTVRFLLNYATRPMQLFGKWGMIAFGAAALSGGATLYMKMAEGLPMNRNPLLMLTAFLLFTGVQFIIFGLLGELVTRTYYESQGKPVYSIREMRNL